MRTSCRSVSMATGPPSKAAVPSSATTTRNPSRRSEYWMLSARAGSSSTTRTEGAPVLGGRGWVRGVGELTELPRQQEADLFGDVHGVVADPLQLAGHH